MTQLKKPTISLIVILVLVIIADQVTKQLAQTRLLDEDFLAQTDKYPACGNFNEDFERERLISDHRKSITVIRHFFDLRYVENCASAFGLMRQVPESFRFPFFLLVSLLAVGFIPYLYFHTPTNQKMMLFALPFILGGAIGNLIDRLVYRYVIDFIRWYVVFDRKSIDWPTFNIADVAIVIGIGLMMLQMFTVRQQEKTAINAKNEVETETDAAI